LALHTDLRARPRNLNYLPRRGGRNSLNFVSNCGSWASKRGDVIFAGNAAAKFAPGDTFGFLPAALK